MKKIKLNNNKECLVDDEDFEMLSKFKWSAEKRRKTWYCILSNWNYKHIGYKRMHRMILGLRVGNKLQVDHIDGNGLNNMKSNLRICTNQQNHWNLKNKKPGMTGLRGVSKDVGSQRVKRFVAQITIGKKNKNLGYFLTAKEAAVAYDKKAKEMRGEFACTNF